MQKPEVSACIVSYNQAPYIERCLQSLLDQGGGHSLEILISDDGSTDGTRDIIARLAAQHPDIIHPFFQEKNLGPTQNYYFIHRQARGKFVVHMDGDDFALPGKLAAQVSYLKLHPECMAVVHKLQFWDKRGNRVERVYPDRFRCKIYDMRNLVLDHPVFLHSALMYREGGLNGILEEGPENLVDFYLYIHLVSQGAFGTIDDVMGGYTHAIGISTKMNLIKLVVEALDYAKTLGLSDADYNRKLSEQYYFFSLKAFADDKDYEHFKKLITLSVHIRIFSLRQLGLYVFKNSSKLIANIKKFKEYFSNPQNR